MQTDEKRLPRDDKLQQLRRELLDRIVRNEARRRTEQNVALGGVNKACESPAAVAGHSV